MSVLSNLNVCLYAFVLLANMKTDKSTSWKKPETAEIQGLSQRLVKSQSGKKSGHSNWKDSRS